MSPTKAILWFVFVTTPAVLVAGFAVSQLKNALLENGVLIDEYIYWLVLFTVMWAALAISSKRLIKEMHARNNSNKSEGDR